MNLHGERVASVSATFLKTRHSKVNAEELSRRWQIGLQMAHDTLKMMTQFGIRHVVHPLKQWYRTDQMQLHLKYLNATVYTDQMFVKVKSIQGNTCAQMFATENFVYAYPMASKSFAWLGFQNFCDDGVPRELVMDDNQSEMGPKSKMRHLANKLHSQMHVMEPYSPWQNHVNDSIQEFDKHWLQTVWTKKYIEESGIMV
jgi:hypothetical protein